ncbi:NB-ARC domain-containing protein [Amycolatopsis aidingensis]|uniref:NB-ARC domain-containing protein n=1 Tax=Amycolatopsis aidingensis TaxID=2842453 RepID=UPI001C0C1C76|nr:NB-ARC domain-containing protein [Amycolatopsis aidingensis]
MSTGRAQRSAHAVTFTSYVGRQREAAEARRLLSASRLVTLTGTGGVGKTRLALQVMRDVAGDFADGAVSVPLAELREPALLANMVGAELGLLDPTEQSILDHLRSQRLLLVLDNFERLIVACVELVRKIITGTEKVTVLVTSRQPLESTGERVMTVPPLYLGQGTEKEEAPDTFATPVRAGLVAGRVTVTNPARRSGTRQPARTVSASPQLAGAVASRGKDGSRELRAAPS